MAAHTGGRNGDPLRVVFISTFEPRECGIATYSEDVIRSIEALGARCHVIAMEQPGKTFNYDSRVIGTINEKELSSYLAAAELINHSDFDVVALQHEFGIYGGEECELVVRFAEAVHKPIVTTFHTVISTPSPGMRRHQQGVGRRADRVVVMNGLVLPLLRDLYDIDPRKVRTLHHGSPVPPCEREACLRHLLELDGRRVLSTFGLITLAKGIDYMIQAMPEIVAQHPDAVYYILGQTHPALKQAEGELYRGRLENLVVELGLLGSVRFVDRYLPKEEIVHYLLATDTYVKPYRNLEQVTRGRLAYAVGCGCPVVSTSYLHARYLLDEERGLLVEPENPHALADACLRLLDNAELRQAMVRRNWAFGQLLYWPRVGADYLGILREAVSSHQ